MRKLVQILLVGSVVSLSCSNCSKKSADTTPPYVPPTTPGPPVDQHWSFETTPTFDDEFSVDGAPDATKWAYDLGGSGWGNDELENYTNSTANANVSGGKLYITAKKESSGGMNYSSARMLSKGLGDFTYGRIEVSAQLPAGRGTWPAIWMLPSGTWAYGDWPNSGEIDIMEHVGYDPGNVHSVHTPSPITGRSTPKKQSSSIFPPRPPLFTNTGWIGHLMPYAVIMTTT